MREDDSIRAEVRSAVLHITLNRPDKLNSFNDIMHGALYDALAAAKDDDGVRAILLTGAGRGFCAGQDLGDRDPSKGRTDLGETIGTFYNPLLRLIRSIEKPIVCAVNGVAAGAGANIAFDCDIVLAARSAKFIEAFAKLGLVPDAGGTWWLSRILGEPRAKALALTATPVSAEQAADWGLIWRAVDDGDLIAEATTLAEQRAAGPTVGLGLTKRLIQDASVTDLDTHLDAERDAQREAGFTDDYAEGVAAFLAKRAPSFQGK